MYGNGKVVLLLFYQKFASDSFIAHLFTILMRKALFVMFVEHLLNHNETYENMLYFINLYLFTFQTSHFITFIQRN